MKPAEGAACGSLDHGPGPSEPAEGRSSGGPGGKIFCGGPAADGGRAQAGYLRMSQAERERAAREGKDAV